MLWNNRLLRWSIREISTSWERQGKVTELIFHYFLYSHLIIVGLYRSIVDELLDSDIDMQWWIRGISSQNTFLGKRIYTRLILFLASRADADSRNRGLRWYVWKDFHLGACVYEFLWPALRARREQCCTVGYIPWKLRWVQDGSSLSAWHQMVNRFY